MMDDVTFKTLFKKVVERYELAPEVAAELLQKILAILNDSENAEDSS